MFKDDELHETRYWESCLELQQQLQETMDNYVKLDLLRVKEYNELVDKYKAKEQECEELKKDCPKRCKLDKYKQALDEIEEFANKACESCKKFFPNFQSDINCTCCQPSLILGIINKVKDGE